MTFPNGRFERSVLNLLRRLPLWVALILAAILYGVMASLPLSLNWPKYLFVWYCLAGSVLAFAILVGWFGVQLEVAHRRQLVEWTSNLRLLTSEEFEQFVGEIFRREGYKVTESGSQEGPDGNIDLRLQIDNRHFIVQCKRWESWLVKVDEIRKFGGTLLSEGLTGASGIFVTLSDFNSQAKSEAKRSGIQLINGRELEKRRQKVRRGEPCPICHESMFFDRSIRGYWFRCVTPGCNGKLDLGVDEGRVLELLTLQPIPNQ